MSRLKEIENRFYKTGYEINTASPEPQQIHADLQYLIYTVKEQAERVQELEEEVEFLSHSFGIEAERVQELEKKHKEYVLSTESNNYNMDVEFGKLYKQNKRYREVIEKAFNRLNDSKRMGLEALEAFEILGQIMEESE